MTTYIGIDPGGKGGIAVLRDGHPLWTEGDLSVQEAAEIINRIINEWDEIHAMLEDTNAFPGQSSVTTAAQFRAIGQWEGILAARMIPYQLVKATAWQKVMLEGKPSPPKKASKEEKGHHRKAIKGYAAIIASRLFPGHDFRRTVKCTTVHDGMVDAALIAEYCRRTWR